MSRQVPPSNAILMWRAANGTYQPIQIGKTKIAVILFALIATSLWALGLTSYLFFKDEVLANIVSNHYERTSAYEDRLIKMRSSLDRITSRQLIDQDHFERKMNVIVMKQSTLEARQKSVMALNEKLSGMPAQPALSRPQPLDETPMKKAESSFLNRLWSADGGFKAANSLKDILENVANSNKSIEEAQLKQVNGLESQVKLNNSILTSILTDLAVPVPQISPMGGTYISDKSTIDPFLEKMLHLEQNFDRFNLLKSTALKLPISRPLPPSHETTSSFGRRIDPFNRTVALHSGIDFRGQTGDAVYSSASGIVTKASSQGGYGLMVEIEHAHGYTTRYAHLSAFEVREGQRVEAGHLLGRVGSTGRSTGAHLHYEIRKNEEALDPQGLLRFSNILGKI